MNNTYTQTTTGLTAFYTKIYGLVGMGLLLSALVAGAMLTVFQTQMISFLQAGRLWLIVVWLVEVALVAAASRAAATNSPLALPMFLGYSALNGFTISFTVAYYTQASVLAAFLSAAGVFFAMAMVGRFIKTDLSGFRKAMLAALMGLIIAGLLNFFFRSSALSWLLSMVSVVLFSGIIAYDNQRIKQVYLQTSGRVGEGGGQFPWPSASTSTLLTSSLASYVSLLIATNSCFLGLKSKTKSLELSF